MFGSQADNQWQVKFQFAFLLQQRQALERSATEEPFKSVRPMHYSFEPVPWVS